MSGCYIGDAHAGVSAACYSSQQGLVHGRQMHKTVSMMMAHLQSAREESNLNADASRAIVLLDFRKAYDTVDRHFMVEALRLFGFDEKFLALMQRLHTNTTARFSVNGKLSSVRPVRSGPSFFCGSRNIGSSDSNVAKPSGAHTSGSTYNNPYIFRFCRRLHTISPQSMSTTSGSGHHHAIWTIIGITGATG